MRTIAVTLLFTIFSTIASHAQAPYNRALGIKFPGGLSITYKKFVTDTRNIEALLTAWHEGLRIAGLYEFNFYSFTNVSGLSWFTGPGAHIGFWKPANDKNYNSQADIGIDGIIGLDYKFKNAPVNLSIDWQPSVTLISNAGFIPAFGGIAARYTF